MVTFEELRAIVGAENVARAGAISDDYGHDECLTVPPEAPELLVWPASAEHVSGVLQLANAQKTPVYLRGAGTGLSGGAVPGRGAIVVSFERMDRILEIDESNHVAVVEPGVTLAALDAALEPRGLVYPIFPGENSATLGGNVATNAGGMRAVKYGVTRNQVLGLTAVLPTGEVIRTGGKFVKASSGYDLTQLLVGSEGTLAAITEVTVKLFPRMPVWSVLLAPFRSLEQATGTVPALVTSGVQPLLVEYIDRMTMMGITHLGGDVQLGVPESVVSDAEAYLLVVIEGRDEELVSRDVERAGEVCTAGGAIDVFVLSSHAGRALVDAREKSFWLGKRMGMTDVVDVVVPRASIPDYVARVRAVTERHGAMISGCGHAGDGNIHLGVFESDAEKRRAIIGDLLGIGVELGGAVSAEHGIGRAKKESFARLCDPAKLALMKAIKRVFDPEGILSPGVLL